MTIHAFPRRLAISEQTAEAVVSRRETYGTYIVLWLEGHADLVREAVLAQHVLYPEHAYGTHAENAEKIGPGRIRVAVLRYARNHQSQIA